MQSEEVSMSLKVLRSHGWSISALAREFGLNWRTVKREVESPLPRAEWPSDHRLWRWGEDPRLHHVADIVAANLSAADRNLRLGGIYNLGAGSPVTVNDVIRLLEGLTAARHARLEHRPPPPAEARHTYADCTAAGRDLGSQVK